MKKVTLVTLSFLSLSRIYATPSTQIWNPSTDIQTAKTVHLGIDNYFSVVENGNPSGCYAFPTDVGVTYGLIKNMEIGIDAMEPTANPLYFNAKYGLSEGKKTPAVSIGIFNAGTKKDVTNYNILYGVAAKKFNLIGRISLGCYRGNDKLMVDEKGNNQNSGIITTWDKTINGKIWACVDYASDKSFYGSLSFGGSYSFTTNVSVILGYVIYNNNKLIPNNTFTTQVDINL
jgi:hypothetical protein